MTLADFLWPDGDICEAAHVCKWPLIIVPFWSEKFEREMYLVTFRPPEMRVDDFLEALDAELKGTTPPA